MQDAFVRAGEMTKAEEKDLTKQAKNLFRAVDEEIPYNEEHIQASAVEHIEMLRRNLQQVHQLNHAQMALRGGLVLT